MKKMKNPFHIFAIRKDERWMAVVSVCVLALMNAGQNSSWRDGGRLAAGACSTTSSISPAMTPTPT